MKSTMRYDVFDLVKLLLSFFIIAIHCGFENDVPHLRVAVPLFFMISSFLFFRGKADKPALKKYILRNVQLYVVWFLILIPFTVYARSEWFHNGIIKGCLIFFRELLFGSTFKGSWYISASVLSVLAIYALSKKIGTVFIVLISSVLYLCCSLVSNYEGLVCNTFAKPLCDISRNLFGGMEKSFFMAMLPMSLGKAFAEKEQGRLAIQKTGSAIWALVGVVLFSMGLLLEHTVMIRAVGIPRDNSCYLTVAGLACSVFYGLLHFCSLEIKGNKCMRVCSTLNYFLHCAVIVCVSITLKITGIQIGNSIRFLLVALCTMSLSTGIYILSKRQRFRMLKKLY